MAEILLSINAGSSSVKVSVYKTAGKGADPKELAVVQVDGLTAPPPVLKYDRGDVKVEGKELKDVNGHESAFTHILDQLISDTGLPEVSKRGDISSAIHRIVHGGDYPRVQVIGKDTFEDIERLSDLAPLHNSRSLQIVRAVSKELGHVKNVAYFDSAFHSQIPRHIRTYPISPKIAASNGLRKYGFHGISYAFIIKAVAPFLNKPISKTNIIALHLGSGASACAIKNGQSLDTSMGLTPLAGLPGATRSGSLDPSLVFHYTNEAGKLSSKSTKDMHITTAEEILNQNSGWKALTGTTDFGTISGSDDEMCKLAFDIFVDRILGYVGSYYLKLGGEVDALVFAGGVGEKGIKLRKAVVEGAASLGFQLDAAKNENVGDGVVEDISSEGAKHRVLVCKTDEQLEMARGYVEDA
ncbi:hypothetical protein FQN54_007097 [Arachnomyces sp. PD_36]|nr:hypothetical protein FQN54_007097 [Arachnomyces sp. PD_36]